MELEGVAKKLHKIVPVLTLPIGNSVAIFPSMKPSKQQRQVMPAQNILLILMTRSLPPLPAMNGKGDFPFVSAIFSWRRYQDLSAADSYKSLHTISDVQKSKVSVLFGVLANRCWNMKASLIN